MRKKENAPEWNINRISFWCLWPGGQGNSIDAPQTLLQISVLYSARRCVLWKPSRPRLNRKNINTPNPLANLWVFKCKAVFIVNSSRVNLLGIFKIPTNPLANLWVFKCKAMFIVNSSRAKPSENTLNSTKPSCKSLGFQMQGDVHGEFIRWF